MNAKDTDSPRGFAFAISAYILWGFLPIYMKAMSHITPVEVLAHRILWSIPIAATVLVLLRRTQDLKSALRSSKTLGMAFITAALISANWTIYIWAIASGNTLDAALGYYINPIFSVFLGAVLLGEKLSKMKWFAIFLAAGAVVLLTLETGRLPIVAVALTVTWGFYAYFKKSLPIGPNQGFLLEVLLLAPPALVFVLFQAARGDGHFAVGTPMDTWLLMGCGVVTAVPLMLYANGAKLLRLSTIGMLQYIAPTLIFLVAVFVLGETFGKARMIAFPVIWLALAIYSMSLVRESRQKNRDPGRI